MQSKQLPIGYWIKQADELLTKGINDIQSLFEITRTDWQVLNTIFENQPISHTPLAALMKPLIDLNTLNKTLERFEERTLLSAETKFLELSARGMALHTACLQKQKEFRQKAMTGITEEEYQQTIATLQKIIGNISMK